METPFTNVHVHVFTSACAPKNFLRIVKSELTRTFPGTIKKVLENKYARQAIWKLNKGILTLNDWLRRRKKGRRRSGLEKYLSFLDVGTRYTQTEIFEEAFSTAKAHDSTARVFGLTLDMDFMDRDGIRPEMPLETQLVEIKKIKRFHPHKFFAFLSVDPRSRSDDELLNWAKTYFETGVTDMKTGITYPYFAGIKLYPALGFFPFDPGLEKLYAYAEDNGIPVMTHCTRSGSLYIGDNIERLIPEEPAMMMPSPANSVAIKAQEEIYSLIKEFYKKGWIKNSSRGNNDIACDLFGHPKNYIPILLRYPKLKICLAHMGGSDEMIQKGDGDQKKIWAVDKPHWSDLIRDLMNDHLNMYTDISYTLSALENEVVKKTINDWLDTIDSRGDPLGNRVMFGTDFFMTERVKKESVLYELAKREIAPDWYEKISRGNPDRYLSKKPPQ